MEGPSLPPGGVLPPPPPEKKEVKPDPGEWYEAMSDMGYPYYWNTVTGGNIHVNRDVRKPVFRVSDEV